MKLILLLSASAAAFGQTALATVTDPTSAVLANAPVSVKNVETGQVCTGATSDTGNHAVTQLPIGTCSLSVTSPGFKSHKNKNFSLSAGQAGREDVALQVGQPDPPASFSESLKK